MMPNTLNNSHIAFIGENKAKTTFKYGCNCIGFSLVELIVIMIMIAILAVVAIPRMADTDGVSSRTYADQLVAAFQFAQTTAQQQDVATTVNLTASGFSVTQNGSVVHNFNGPYQTALTNGVSISPATSITFGTNGLPNLSGKFTVVDQSSSFTVSLEPTGFSHE